MAYRAVVLGGRGHMGSGVIRGLVQHEECNEILIADKRSHTAQVSIDGKEIRVSVIDIRDHNRTVDLLRDYDVVVNAVGPYYHHGARVLDAAIDAKCDYVDLCDDLDATQLMLDRADDARKAGVTAVIGCGTSPGASNMLVAFAASMLDELIEAKISWVVSMADAGGVGVGFHALHMCASEVFRVSGGVGILAPALGISSVVEFPMPYGPVEVYEVAHPEPFTLKQRYPALQTAWNRGAVYPKWAMERLLAQAHLGLADDEPLHLPGGEVMPMSVAIGLDVRFREKHPDVDLGPIISYGRVDVAGMRNGQMCNETYLAPDRMSEGAGGAAAVAADLVSRGQVLQGSGVYAPESAFDPGTYIRHMDAAGVHLFRLDERSLTGTERLAVTRNA